MRYYGGGIGHLNNTPPQQAHRSDPLDPNSDEMAVDEDEDSDTESSTRDGMQDIVMNGEELEVGVGDEEGRGGEDDSDEDDYDSCGYDEMDDRGDEDEDEDEDEGGSDNDEEDDYGYASA